MRYRSLVAVVLWAAAAVSAQTPVLTVTDVNYAAVDEGSPDVVLVIDGSGFVSEASPASTPIDWLTLIGPTRITAVMPAALSVKPWLHQLLWSILMARPRA